jgi:hypothetical protein
MICGLTGLMVFLSMLIGCSERIDRTGESPPMSNSHFDQKILEQSREAVLSNYKNSLQPGITVVSFAYIGSIAIEGKFYPVFYARNVIDGMLAPRGDQQIIIADQDGVAVTIIDCYMRQIPIPLFCKDDTIFLFGRTKEIPQQSGGELHNGNAIRFIHNPTSYDFVDVYEYGSSGGIEDKVPSDGQRKYEIDTWDSK